MKNVIKAILLVAAMTLPGCVTVSPELMKIPTFEVIQAKHVEQEDVMEQANDMLKGLFYAMNAGTVEAKDEAVLKTLAQKMIHDAQAMDVSLLYGDLERFEQYKARLYESIQAMSDILAKHVDETAEKMFQESQPKTPL